MKIEIVSQKKNALIGRDEAMLRVHHESQRTPSRQELLKEAARAIKANEQATIIDRIITLQGEAISEVKVLAYEKKEDVPAYMAEKMKRRMKVKGAAEAEKAAA